MKGKFERYGLVWPDGTTDLQVEFQMIRKGGSFTLPNGKQAGDGLFEHYMNARKLLWTDRYRHRWTDLLYREFIQNSVTIMMGAGSTQKTSHASEFALINYWLYPKETLVILSTTTVSKLEMAVFGEIKMLWQSARDRWGDYLAGNPIDSKHAIATDAVEEGQVRDLRRGVIGLACFPSGTLVNTPSGNVPIESLKVGDEVLNAIGVGRVKQTMSRVADRLVRITLSDGSEIDCTEDHPIFTNRGWVRSSGLLPFDTVFSTYETMRLLRGSSGAWIPKQKTLLSNMPGQVSRRNDVRVLFEKVSKMEEMDGSVLQRALRGKVGVEESSPLHKERSLRALQESDGRMPFESLVLLPEMQVSTGGYAVQEVRKILRFDKRIPKEEEDHFLQQALLVELEGEENTKAEQHPNPTRAGCLESFSGPGDMEFSGSHRNIQGGRKASLVQGGCGVPRCKTGRGNRRRGSQDTIRESTRLGAREEAGERWVVGVKVLESGSDDRFDASEGGYRVHNIEVSGHPSYSVNNTVVHNCYVGKQFVGLGTYAGIKQKRVIFVADELQFMAPTFLECLPNMMQGTELLKVIGSGNPKHDPLDQLGRAAEPKAGWESLGDIKKTTVWETKFLNGRCVNLVGTDSPNFDYPEDQPTAFKGLVSWKTVASVAAFWGKDSLEYSKQCLGTMRIGMIGSRVITAALCKQHKAQDRALWESTNRTRIYACDPAWGGINADRCVAGWGEFGIDKDRIQILRVNQPVVVPIIAASSVLPDDQIAHFIRRDTERLSIEPEDIFYDSTGRGTTGSAFARIFGQRVPVPIAFGDRPSRRPVRHDLFVIEPDGTKRLKRCDEYYQKFVTELWFSVRYIIECDQMRELPDDVMMEGTMREYKTVAGGKIEVESKDDTRERMGCSPDLFDWLAILVEGARQRGFKIQRLGVTMTEEEDSHGWMLEEQEAYQDVLQGAMLTH